MDSNNYYEILENSFQKSFAVAAEARAKGYDPETFVEIKPAPDIASRVEGIIGVDGLADTIRAKSDIQSRYELAFEMAKEICNNPKFDYNGDIEKRLTLATRVGLAILTEGTVVAPTEGFQGVELHKSSEGSDYIAVLYAGPIRGAGGTAAALSVALADYSRRLLNIGSYKAQQSEIERYLEEIHLYDLRCAHLQYYPSEADIRVVLENCPVCIDGLPTEEVEVSVHRNMKRLDKTGKEQAITNRIRSGICLVTCEGVAQKAKSVLKHTKNIGLDWSWLNGIIKVDKGSASEKKGEKKDSVFLQELVAGRPVLSYPEHSGSFRLRYGRSRVTGIAAKGFSPATMLVLDEFIATGTQVKVEKPGKGSVAGPVDSIEGPFVKLDTGEALRINDAETARELRNRIKKIIAVGDILITYGDFKKSNTPLLPTSYVEEYWIEQLKAKGHKRNDLRISSFKEAYDLSEKYGVPMHPRYIYDYSDLSAEELPMLASAVLNAKFDEKSDLFGIGSIRISGENKDQITDMLERACIPHVEGSDNIAIEKDDAQSLVSSLGFSDKGTVKLDKGVLDAYKSGKSQLEMLNAVAPFRILKRSTRIGGRIGRPEKARERLMKPAPHVLFPISESGGKERSIAKAYSSEKRKFSNTGVEVEMIKYRCETGKEVIHLPYCRKHRSKAVLERICRTCGRMSKSETCANCGGRATASEARRIDIIAMLDEAMKNVGVQTLPKNFKGVIGLSNRNKTAEPIEKGLLRASYGVYIFKDGTVRFDATDMPMTHFYPREIGVSVAKLKELGYDRDCYGNGLERDDQLLELRHQDVILNNRGADYFINVSKFIDQLLKRYYGLEPFYNITEKEQLIGHLAITLSPHTSAGVLCRIIGFTDANVGFAHPYVIACRRRNCDGDEDTTILLLDALINFSRSYLPTTIGGTMDAPLILTLHVDPGEVDDEVHDMEVTQRYGLEFYDKTFEYPAPGDVSVELVKSRFKDKRELQDLMFTHLSGPSAITDAPNRSSYTKFKSMGEKIEFQFNLMDRLCSVDRADTARKLIISHFIPDLIGNMNSFSKQNFRCVACNAKYRRAPLQGKCTRCNGGKLVLTISKGSIEKYLETSIELANRYNLEPYIKQRLLLVKDEIQNVFGGVGGGQIPTKQFNLANFM
ncbi:MAG: DNA polymerase II large subunit [Candidatus Micrarchaeota archaeon]|nr:DNA polymerase II large subunit [Candidatus Micrarchaeota archaeon]